MCILFITAVVLLCKVSFIFCVNGIPSIQSFTFPTEVIKGQSVTVTCAVSSGTGAFMFRWTKDGLVMNDQPLARIQTSEEYSLLSLKSVDGGRSGNYTCLVSNALGVANHTAELVVYEHPEWTNIPEDSEVVLGQEVRIDCSASGIPHPKVEWKKSASSELNVLNTGGRHKLLSNGSLLISDVREKDEGEYECRVYNGIGEGLKKVVKVFVNVPPLFREKYQLLKVRSSHSGILRCDVTGNSPITVKWSKEYTIDSKDNRYKTQETPLPNGLLSELFITRVGRQDAGVYVCVATNPYGKQEKNIKLVVLEPPSSPSDIAVKQILSTEATIQWTAPYSGNSPLTRYVLQYWRDTGAPPRLEEVEVTSDKSFINLKDLRPGTSYVVRIIAENEFGSSTPSVPVRFYTAEANPSGYPTDLSVYPRGPHALSVRWKAPAPDQRNGAIQGYELGFRFHYSMDPYVYQEAPLGPGISQEFVVEGLRENTEYEIVVRAYNRAGRGPTSVPVVAKTRDKGNLVAPELWAESTSASTVTLRWSGNEEVKNGILRHILYYRPEGGSWTEKVINNINTDSYLLTHLEENTMYHIYIQALSGNEQSNPSATVSVRTADPSFERSSMTQTKEVNYQTTLVISLSVVISCVVIVCVIAGACVYVTRVTSVTHAKRDGQPLSDFAEQPSTSRSTPLSRHPSNFRYVDVNTRPLIWCSTPAPPNDYPSPYATLPLRNTPVSKRWQSEDRQSDAASDRSESLINQRVEMLEEKNTSCRDLKLN